MYELIIVPAMLANAFLAVAIIATWFFALRPYVAKHGRARITAITWLFSMWADWSTACEIAKETKTPSWPARVFLTLWVLWIGLFAMMFALGAA